MNLPKPKYCGQDWGKMEPTEGGRVCGQCSKVIIDFSHKSWAEIQRMQLANNVSLCGMYSQKQLDNWGTQLPVNPCSRVAATIALLLSISIPALGHSQSQVPIDSAYRALIHGKVMGETGYLSNVKIFLLGTPVVVNSDSNGRFELDLTNYKDTLDDPTLRFTCDGYLPTELMLGKVNNGLNIPANIVLRQHIPSAIYFAVKKPTFKQRIQRKFRRLFRR